MNGLSQSHMQIFQLWLEAGGKRPKVAAAVGMVPSEWGRHISDIYKAFGTRNPYKLAMLYIDCLPDDERRMWAERALQLIGLVKDGPSMEFLKAAATEAVLDDETLAEALGLGVAGAKKWQIKAAAGLGLPSNKLMLAVVAYSAYGLGGTETEAPVRVFNRLQLILAPRRLEALEIKAMRGISWGSTAVAMGIKRGGIKSHVSAIKTKLGCQTTVELIMAYIDALVPESRKEWRLRARLLASAVRGDDHLLLMEMLATTAAYTDDGLRLALGWSRAKLTRRKQEVATALGIPVCLSALATISYARLWPGSHRLKLARRGAMLRGAPGNFNLN